MNAPSGSGAREVCRFFESLGRFPESSWEVGPGLGWVVPVLDLEVVPGLVSDVVPMLIFGSGCQALEPLPDSFS